MFIQPILFRVCFRILISRNKIVSLDIYFIELNLLSSNDKKINFHLMRKFSTMRWSLYLHTIAMREEAFFISCNVYFSNFVYLPLVYFLNALIIGQTPNQFLHTINNFNCLRLVINIKISRK